jgi:hypothetical protein
MSIKKNFKSIFCTWRYLLLLLIVALGFVILFAVLDGLLFFSPYLVFWLPIDASFNFTLSIIISIFVGLVVTMNVNMIFRNHNNNNKSVMHFGFVNDKSKKKEKTKTSYYLYLSSLLAIISTGCLGCSSALGLWIFTFLAGIMGITASTSVSSFLSEYQTPIKIITLGFLIWAFISINKEINNGYHCNIVNNNKKNFMQKE